MSCSESDVVHVQPERPSIGTRCPTPTPAISSLFYPAFSIRASLSLKTLVGLFECMAGRCSAGSLEINLFACVSDVLFLLPLAEKWFLFLPQSHPPDVRSWQVVVGVMLKCTSWHRNTCITPRVTHWVCTSVPGVVSYRGASGSSCHLAVKKQPTLPARNWCA